MEEDGYEVPIKARNKKAHLTFTVRRNVRDDEETVEEGEVKVEVKVEVKEVAEISNAIETDVNNILELEVEPFKTTIKILQPTPAGARLIADELNKLPEIKGKSQWSANQKGDEISILGLIDKENIQILIEPLVINIMVEFRGDEK